MYSSLHDQLKLGRSILRHEALPAARTRRWLPPWTHTASPWLSVGAPWEIYRAVELTPDERVVDLYTKGSDVREYHVSLALLPAYGLVASVLTASPPLTNYAGQLLRCSVLPRIVPAADAIARQQAAAAFAGLYVAAGDSARAASALRLVADDVGLGLRVRELCLRGADITRNARAALTNGLPVNATMRLYPSGLVSPAAGQGLTASTAAAARVSFRAVAAPEPRRGSHNISLYT